LREVRRGRGELEQRQWIALGSSTTPRRTRVGTWTNWRVSNSIASASASGATLNSDNPARSKKPPTPGRMAPRSPIRLPRSRRPTEPDDGATGSVQPVQVPIRRLLPTLTSAIGLPPCRRRRWLSGHRPRHEAAHILRAMLCARVGERYWGWDAPVQRSSTSARIRGATGSEPAAPLRRAGCRFARQARVPKARGPAPAQDGEEEPSAPLGSLPCAIEQLRTR
jgi:hypothetical protein